MNTSNTVLENKNKIDEDVSHSRSTLPLQSTYLPLYFPQSSPSPSLINRVGNNTDRLATKSADLTRVAEKKRNKKLPTILVELPQFFNYGNKIRIPLTIERIIRRIPAPILKEIHPEREVAIEMCLLFTLQLTSNYFGYKHENQLKGWKSLNTKFLRPLFSNNPNTYKNIITALLATTKKGAIIELKEIGKVGIRCNEYRLVEAFRSKKLVHYEIRTKQVLKILNNHYLKLYIKAIANPICNNLIQFYNFITLPTEDEIITEAKRLVKEPYIKNGKKLKFLHKHARSGIQNPENYSIVEDAIEKFKDLTENGLMIPREGSKKSGGRVNDAFTIMSSWIRSLIKVDGVSLDVWDLRCLHPNLAMSLYGGSRDFLTHDIIAKESGIKEEVVKVEHLSFFNKHPKQMELSPLYNFYIKSEPKMMKNIINEKYESRYKHKITSRRMFKKEVEIMTDVIKQLNKEGIYVLYIYDALGCHPNHSERVIQVLNETVLKHGVKTTVKLPEDAKSDLKIEHL